METGSRYTRRQILGLVLGAVVGIAGLVFFLATHRAAFPRNSVTFAINRGEAIDRATDLIRKAGVPAEQFRRATVFDEDDQALAYAERELGMRKTEELLRLDLNLYRFSTRFFQPLKEEEYLVSFLPSGRFAGFVHRIPEAEKGAELSPDEARRIAETYLVSTARVSLADWRPVEARRQDQPNRTDYDFTYEMNGFAAGEATYRLSIGVAGNRVVRYGEYLKIPEAWQRRFMNSLSQNELAQSIAEAAGAVLFVIPGLIVFFIYFKQREIRLAWAWRVSLLFALIGFLASLNGLPLSLYSYDTTQSWTGFLSFAVLSALLSNAGMALAVLLVLAAGETLYRQVFPEKPAIEKTLDSGLAVRDVNLWLFIGSFTALAALGYQNAYYLLGKKIGFWSPADVDYSDIFSTAVPWIYPLFYGFTAAVFEEGVFRLFGISLLRKYLKSTWLAVVITAFAWGFLHSNYPQMPWFVRGIEVGIMGIVFGILFVRYGFVPSVAAHFTFNAFQTAVILGASGSLFVQILSTAASFLPLIAAGAACVYFLSRGGFRDIDITNRSIAPPPALPEPAPVPDRTMPLHFFTTRVRAALICAGLLGAAATVIVYPKIKPAVPPTSLDRPAAIAAASGVLEKRGVATASYRTSAVYENAVSGSVGSYILERSSWPALQQVYRRLPPLLWNARFFKPLQKDEYRVRLLPDGRPYAVDHIVDEKMPGAELSRQEAQRAAENFLAVDRGYDLSRYRIVYQNEEKRAARVDHILDFEDRDWRIGDARLRSSVTIQGSEPTFFDEFIKIPEEWVRERETMTGLDYVLSGILVVFGIFLFGSIVLLFVRVVRSEHFRMYRAAGIMAAVAIASLVNILNQLPAMYQDYPTFMSLWRYILMSVIVGNAIRILLFSFCAGLLIEFALDAWRMKFGQVLSPDPSSRSRTFQDVLVAAYTLPFAVVGTECLISLAGIAGMPGLVQDPFALGDAAGFASSLPALSSLIRGALRSILVVLGGAVAAMTLFSMLRRWGYVVAALAVMYIIGSLIGAHRPADYGAAVLSGVIYAGLFSAVVLAAVRRNLPAYALSAWVYLTGIAAARYFYQSGLFWNINGWLMTAGVLLPLGGYLWLAKKSRGIVNLP